ncbi:MAG: M23 family metallopeptidase [Bdellovibrionales bacterium]|nr:M23 family metallopeptidase [Bdellovibrionales bacterium]
MIILASTIPALVHAWQDIYSDFLETTSPVIELESFPRGVGVAPVSAHIKFSDFGSGLDEVIVRTRQRRKVNELLRKSLNGISKGEVIVEFPGKESGLEEGTATLEIKVFDKSFWSNGAEKDLPLLVDYEKPRVEIISVQHNAHVGGSQLVFYKAYDNTLAISGVSIKGRRFIGFPAQGIDSELLEPNLFVALYAIDLENPPLPADVTVFAEDQAGNSDTKSFYNKILSVNGKRRDVGLSEQFIANKIDSFLDPKVSSETPLTEKFNLVNQRLRNVNESQLNSYLQGPRFEKLWDSAFEAFPATPAILFADNVNYYLENEFLASSLQINALYLFPGIRSEVPVVAPGVVLFTGSLGVYGESVLIDHGLGLVSFYGQLESFQVAKGDKVNQGDVIGIVGSSGLALKKSLLFGMRVHGVPVNPQEWFDKSWYHSHITLKIEELKKDLGIPIYRPLN